MKYLLIFLLSFIATVSSAQLIGAGNWRIVAEGRPGTTEINDVATNQDFATMYQIPAGALVAGKRYKVTISIEYVTGTSTVTVIRQLEVGGVAVYSSGTTDLPDGITRSGPMEFMITGTAAAGAIVSVLCASNSGVGHANGVVPNTVDQTPGPVVNTSSAANIVFSITYSGTGSTESTTLVSFLVEESF